MSPPTNGAAKTSKYDIHMNQYVHGEGRIPEPSSQYEPWFSTAPFAFAQSTSRNANHLSSDSSTRKDLGDGALVDEAFNWASDPARAFQDTPVDSQNHQGSFETYVAGISAAEMPFLYDSNNSAYELPSNQDQHPNSASHPPIFEIQKENDVAGIGTQFSPYKYTERPTPEDPSEFVESTSNPPVVYYDNNLDVGYGF